MARAAVPITVLLFFLSSVQPLRAEGPDVAALDGAVREALEAWKVPGAAVVIVRDDRALYLKGHGVREAGGKEAVTPDTLFPLGSCTKAFTTTAMAMLVDQKKMSWDDPVCKHVRFFRLSDPLANSQVTLRDLVTHRTGVGPHDLLWYHARWSGEEAVRRVGLLPLDRPFRTTFQYQTTMFTAAGLAVAFASKTSWADFVEKQLFDPLGMKTAGCSTASFKSEDRASGHVLDDRGRVVVLPAWYPLKDPEPAGSIHASARDLAPWLRFHLAGGCLGNRRLVSATALGETHTPQTVIPLEGETLILHPETKRMSYGMGWVIQDYKGHRLVSHTGVIDGFRVQITLVPRARLGVAILANLHQTRMNLALGYRLLDLLLGLPQRNWDAYLTREVEKDRQANKEKWARRLAARHRGTHPSLGLAAYTGTYEHPAYGTARVVLERGQLVWRWSSFDCPLEHFHYDTFLTRQEALGPFRLTFALDATGKVAELAVGGLVGVTFSRK
jgi:CubicO group peptidase (beta-lactamase class C family)